ncbi:MAG: PAS domain S-box protein [Desulfobacterales bacterium]|nr:PAS domain S-box protein [Desulfobacterales bacterium]
MEPEIPSYNDLLRGIDRLKKEMEQLRDRERVFRELFFKSPAAMVITRLSNGEFMEVNDRFCELFGYTRDQIRGRTSVETGFWETARDRHEMKQRLVEKGSGDHRVVTYRDKSGDTRTGELSLELMTYQGTECIFSTLTDITDRQRAEEALRESEDHFHRILNHATAVIYVKDTEGRYTYVNKAYEAFIEIQRSRIIGKTDFELFPASVANALTEIDRKVIQTREPQELEEMVPEGGDMQTYLSVKFPLIRDKDQVYGVCGISTNIQERKNAEREKERLIVSLQNALTEIKILQGIIPICANCMKIRDDHGYWNQLESYIEQHSGAAFSHSMCPPCAEKLYGDEPWFQRMQEKRRK